MHKRTLPQMFDLLGDAEVTMPDGLGFYITRKCVEDEFGGDEKKMISRLPRPDYEHRIYKDESTDNYMVLRPGAGNRYWEHVLKMRRIR